MEEREREIREPELDQLDLEILRCLMNNSRESNIKIAEKLRVSEGTVRRRIKKMVDAKVIDRFTVALNPQKLGFKVHAKIGLDVDPSKFNKVTYLLRRLDEAYFVALATGKHDVLMDVFVKDMNALKEFLTDKLGPTLGVRNIDTSIVIDVKKQDVSFHLKI